MLEVEAV